MSTKPLEIIEKILTPQFKFFLCHLGVSGWEVKNSFVLIDFIVFLNFDVLLLDNQLLGNTCFFIIVKSKVINSLIHKCGINSKILKVNIFDRNLFISRHLLKDVSKISGESNVPLYFTGTFGQNLLLQN